MSKQSEIFWKACRSNNVKIVITKYPIRLPFNEIEKTAKKHGVKLTYFGQSRIVRHSKIGLKTLWKLPLNLQGTEDKKKSFELCHASNTCILLEEGKIYTCAPIPYIKYFNKHFGTNVEVSPNDYINIYEVKNIEEVFEFLCKPMPFCRYCNRREPVYGIDWDTSKKEISEWV